MSADRAPTWLLRTPVKILHLITDLDRGGAETMLVRLVTRMDRAHFQPVVVSLMDEGRLGAEIRAAGIPLHTLSMAHGRPTAAAMLRLARLFRRERPQLVQTWLYHADLLGLLACMPAGRPPLVWNLRCSDMDLAQYPQQTRLVLRLLAWLSSWPAAVIVNSEAGRRHHQALGYRPRRWELVPNGFDTDRFRPDERARQEWRRRLGVGAAQPLVGMVARVDPMKDHATFLAAAAQLAAARPDAAFLLVGRGTQALEAPPDLAGRLRALGEQADMAGLLPALDLLVLSSAFGEGFPNALGEAMACGVPCVASNVGDAALIIGETGMVVPPREPQALARAVLGWLGHDPLARARAGQAARARVVEHYSIGAVVDRYQRLYDTLARGQ